MKEIEFHIEGMKCEGCVKRVENVLASIKEVLSYQVSLEDKRVVVKIKKEKIEEKIIQKIENLGFEVTRI